MRSPRLVLCSKFCLNSITDHRCKLTILIRYHTYKIFFCFRTSFVSFEIVIFFAVIFFGVFYPSVCFCYELSRSVHILQPIVFPVSAIFPHLCLSVFSFPSLISLPSLFTFRMNACQSTYCTNSRKTLVN